MLVYGENWVEMIDVDPPKLAPVTEQTREITVRESQNFRGSVRIALADFYTAEEYEEMRSSVLSKPLP